jgi:hypothetical protein
MTAGGAGGGGGSGAAGGAGAGGGAGAVRGAGSLGPALQPTFKADEVMSATLSAQEVDAPCLLMMAFILTPLPAGRLKNDPGRNRAAIASGDELGTLTSPLLLSLENDGP